MQSVKLDPCCSAVVKVQLTPHTSKKAPVYVECDPDLETRTGLTATDAMFAHAEDGTAEIVVTNPTPLPQMVEEHTNLGAATPAWVADPDTPSSLLPHPEEERCEEDLDTLVVDDLSSLEPPIAHHSEAS